MLFTTKYAVPRQLKDRILELSIRKRQRNFSVVFLFFVSCEEKDCYRVVSVEQLGLTAARTAGTVTGPHSGDKQVTFSQFFSSFESRGITKHLMTGPSGNSEFCFPSTFNVPLGFASGNIEVSGKQNSLFPLGPVIKCLLMLMFMSAFFTLNSCLRVK